MKIRAERWTANRRGSLLAQLALVLQLAVTLTHHHSDYAYAAPNCGAFGNLYTHEGCGHPSGHAPERGAHEDTCELCSLLALSRTALEPQTLIITQLVEWHGMFFDAPAVAALRGRALLVIRTRGPPQAAIT